MSFGFKSFKFLAVLSLSLFLLPAVTPAQHYKQTDLVSDIPGMAPVTDPNLLNPWGLTRSPNGSPWWIGNNNSGTSTLYNGSGNAAGNFPDPHPDSNGNGINSPFNNFVMVPPPGFAPGTQSAPTGVVFNGSTTDFLLVPGVTGTQAVFIFVTEDGTISGWNPGVGVAAGAKPPSVNAVLKVDNSQNGGPNGAVYKGATSGEIDGHKFLYVTNFRSAKVEVYDTNFNRLHLDDDAFDPNGDGDHDRDDQGTERVPHGFAPFNIQNIGGILFVTYAKQDAPRHDPVGGDGFGYVVLFTPSGHVIGHLQHGDWLNAPWGVVWTTRDFGEYSNAILVGNFRSGWIAAYNGFTHKFIDFVRNGDGSLMTIDGLWSLTFGNDGSAGLANTLYFTAGPNNENDGLFGTITPIDGLDGDEE
ncbi:MAG TPA: TIGR03118 family protein [Candidatus Acidoferrum sp.]|nr:TIGR03118 family protein [Candidatus Acidoferrum sp.]